jgi:UDP:flavonoid glycosyltransferase YjiC (YdhE family)
VKGHVAFAAAPLAGHLGPLLAQADELVRRGWRVSVISLDDAAPMVADRAGVSFVGLGQAVLAPSEIDRLRATITREPSFARSMVTVINTLQRGWTAAYDRSLPRLRDLHPDLLVADLSSTAEVSAAETLGLPYVLNNPDLLTVLPPGILPLVVGIPLLLSGRSVRSHRRRDRWLLPLQRAVGSVAAALVVERPLNQSRRSRGLRRVDYQRWFRDRLILVDSAFGLEYPRPLPPTIQMVGPMLPRSAPPLPVELDTWLRDGSPVVYVNLGTIARPWRDLVQRLAYGFTETEFRALWVLPGDVRWMVPDPLPPSIRLERWVPTQLGVLAHPNVRAFVSHCGVNSVHESVQGDTPVVGIPLFAAQGDMAQRVEDAGIGWRLDKQRFTPNDLRAQLHRALHSGEVHARLAVIRATFDLAGGVARAADLIEAAVPSRR